MSNRITKSELKNAMVCATLHAQAKAYRNAAAYIQSLRALGIDCHRAAGDLLTQADVCDEKGKKVPF